MSRYWALWEVWRALKRLEMLSAAPRATLKVVFHCRVLFPLRTHINFTRVNKMYGRSRVHFKVERRLTFKFARGLPYIASIIFTCVRTEKYATAEILSYASFVLTKLPACSITQHTHAEVWNFCGSVFHFVFVVFAFSSYFKFFFNFMYKIAVSLQSVSD